MGLTAVPQQLREAEEEEINEEERRKEQRKRGIREDKDKESK